MAHAHSDCAWRVADRPPRRGEEVPEPMARARFRALRVRITSSVAPAAVRETVWRHERNLDAMRRAP